LLLGYGGQTPILGPQPAVAQPGSSQQVSIDIANTSAHQLLALDQKQHFGVAGHRRNR
jgi:hypothetical protein